MAVLRPIIQLPQLPGEVSFVPAPPPARDVWTSASHPLRIGWLEMPSPWRLGLTIAPGKSGISSEGHRWARDLEVDLDVIVREGVRTLVCLVEPRELEEIGIPDLLVAARARGLHVIHQPIKDVSIPTVGDARSLVRRLVERSAEPIVVHCVGGLGRSGVIGGCVLRALGVSAADALKRLRSARGERCPETSEQRAFVERFSIEG